MDLSVSLPRPGGPEQLSVQKAEPQAPGRGQVRIRHQAIGVNFVDIYHRTGLYPLPLPAVPGVEGAGVIEAVGEDVRDLKPGQRVAYAGALVGAYASTRLLPAERAIPLPDAVSSRMAAASMLRGLTAHMLLTRTWTVGEGTWLLVHAAAGGLGTVLTRWARQLGATVIGSVSSEAKAEIARANGAAHVVIGRDADIVAEVGRLTAGRGVDFTIDGLGGAMLDKSFACTRKFGMVASIGQAAGAIPPIAVTDLGPARSLCFSRPSVFAYSSEPETYRTAAAAVIEAIRQGFAATPGQDYPLAEVVRAHTDLEAGLSTGSPLLIP